MVTGMTAGCSSQSARFAGLDDIFTGSTPNQQQIIDHQSQPFPGTPAPAAAPPPVDRVPTGSVSRGSLPPVSSDRAAAAMPSAPPMPSAPRVATVQPQIPAEVSEVAGWSRAGGTQVTAKQGETVYNLSRRFGVPANVIAKVNGLQEASSLQAGQKLVIPTYVYSNAAPVSAPDNNPNVADARSSTGTKSDTPSKQVPVPSQAPAKNLAVVPQPPKVKDSATAAASSGKAAKGGAYTVQDGDTLTRIARKTGVSVAALKSANGMQDGALRIGQTLKVPAGGAQASAAKAVAAVDQTKTGAVPPAEKAGQTQNLAAQVPPKKADKVIEQAEQEPATAPNATGIDRMRWPVRGKVISNYGKGAAKDGIDIAVPSGTPIKAAENGVVIYAGDGLKEFGNTVLVRHENGLVTVYGHASELKVQRGQKVKRGDDIAVSGMSGSADAPKLHFEVRKNSAPVDPSTYLE